MSKQQTVLVTGADGFIGSHLVEYLHAEGYQVRALVQYNAFNRWGWLEEAACKHQVEIFSGDVRDPFFCKKLLLGIDCVCHLAALIAIPYSYIAPQSYVETNVTGTLNMCQAALEQGVKRFIHISTSEVYGTAQYVPIDEQHPLQAQSPYSASKIGADAMAMSYHKAFALPVTIARPFNTYGPRQSARAIIPSIISQMLSGVSTIQVGDLSPTRDLTYVKDTCGALCALIKNGHAGEVINIGSNREISMGKLFDLLKSLTGSDATFQCDPQRVRPKDSEVYRLMCNNDKLKAMTGFEPSFGLRAGLIATIDWFKQKENLRQYKAHCYNV